jgi:hypothetical protein
MESGVQLLSVASIHAVNVEPCDPLDIGQILVAHRVLIVDVAARLSSKASLANGAYDEGVPRPRRHVVPYGMRRKVMVVGPSGPRDV